MEYIYKTTHQVLPSETRALSSKLIFLCSETKIALDFKKLIWTTQVPKTRKPGNYPAFCVGIEMAKTGYRRQSRQNSVAEVGRPLVVVHSVAAPSSVENLRVRSVRVCL